MFRNSNFSLLSKKKNVLQLVILNVLILIIGYLFIAIVIEPLFPINKDNESMKSFVEFLQIISVLVIILVIIIINSIYISKYYQMKYSNKHTNNHELFLSTEVAYLQSIRNKIIVGLENIKQESYASEFLLDTYPSTMATTSSMLDLFPSEIRTEIETKIRGKTIFTLIEIAYQDPTETNPARISKSLNIPPSSITREIKKLLELDYLETHVTESVIKDARIRNFKITSKGFTFLTYLNGALKMTIDRLKVREHGVESI